MSAVRRWTCPMVTPGSIGRGARAIGATLPCGRCDDVVMHTRCQARTGRSARVMAGEYRFRVVYQASDGNAAGTELATHIGVAVGLRGDREEDRLALSGTATASW